MDLEPHFEVGDGGRVRLYGSSCPTCGAWSFPARTVCATCRARSQEPAALSGRGHLKEWTRIEVPPQGFDSPILVGNVVLDEGPVLFALLSGQPSGAEVEAIACPVRDGKPGFAFQSVA